MDKQQIDVSALYGFEAGLREGAGELERARDTAVRLEGRVAELEAACIEESHEIEQTLGKALGYPRFKDDPINFPNVADDQVCVGDHVAQSLATEAARKLAELEAAVAKVTRERDLAIAHDTQPYPTAEAYEIVCKLLRRAEGEKATMRAALEKAGKYIHALSFRLSLSIGEYEDTSSPEFRLAAECDAALAGTGDEVGAVVRASVEYMRLCADTRLWYPNDELETAVADLLAKQPAWEAK